jgi:hypothetical protein
MSKESTRGNGHAPNGLGSAACSALLLVMATFWLVVPQPASVSRASSGGEATPAPAVSGWSAHASDELGIALQAPPAWYVYAHTMPGRHSGLDPLLLTSFEVQFEAEGRGLGIPAKGAAVLIAFEGNDRDPEQSLVDYAAENLESPFYYLTRRELMLGLNPAVEMEGETGKLYVFGRGPNVYSAFTFAGNDPGLTGVVRGTLAALSPLRDGPVSTPRGTRALRGVEGEFLQLSEGPRGITHAWGGPSMKMPWDRSATYRYTGGPHDWSMDWTCHLAPVDKANGLDFGMAYKEVLAVADGTVQWGDAGGATGKYVIVDHGNGWSSRYLHFSSIDPTFSWGQAVSQGRVLGISGTAGSGPHLHLELRHNDSVPESWHGTVLDGYMPRMFVTVDDESEGWNYQGTLTRGSESTTVLSYCGGETIKWVGSLDTIVAGDGQPVGSTNERRTGDASPTPTPTCTPTSTPTPVPAPDVSIDKRLAGIDPQGSQRITFTLVIANTGDKVASGVVVTDIMPAQVLAPTYDSTLAIIPTGPLSYVWDVGRLAPGDRGVITLSGWASLDHPITNRATIWDAEDRTPGNNMGAVMVGGWGVYLPLCMREFRADYPSPSPTPEGTATPTPTATPENCTEGVANGGFEQDGDWEIPDTWYDAGYTTAKAHSGARSMRVGIVQSGDNIDSYSSARQLITVPADASSANLRFWLYSLSDESVTGAVLSSGSLPSSMEEAASSGDAQFVLILDEQNDWIDTLLWQRQDDQDWAPYEHSLIDHAGQTVKLHFGVYNDGVGGVTGMYVDDVSLEICSQGALASSR